MMTKVFAVFIGLLALSDLAFADSEPSSGRLTAKFFLKSYSTTTVTTLSFVTTTQPYFCAVTAGNNACGGRRLRRKRRLEIPLTDSDSEIRLENSKDDASSRSLNSKSSNDGKLFFTIWTSTTTTVTLTSTFTNTSITLSASAYCTFANYNVPLC